MPVPGVNGFITRKVTLFMPRVFRTALVLFWILLGSAFAFAEAPALGWTSVADGLDIGRFQAQEPADAGSGVIVVLRIDPRQWEAKLLSITGNGESASLTARQWSNKYHLAAAINAGMFAADYKTHVGYMKSGSHVNSRSPNSYRSVAAFNPLADSLPTFHIFDLDSTDIKTISSRYQNVVQNLRLIKSPGENCWTPQDKEWSEAALGEDKDGRMLLIYCRAPYSMFALNEILLALPLNLVAAQHLEGGSEAQFYLNYNNHHVELVGGYEMDFDGDAPGDTAWPIPNVIGIAPKTP
jgi:hypothetical protein